MSEEHDPARRILLTALAGLTLANVPLVAAASDNANVLSNNRTLVVYFTRSGNTRVIAGVIHRSLKTDLFEIEPAKPYPEDYFQTVAQAKSEHDRGALPALKIPFPTWQVIRRCIWAFPSGAPACRQWCRLS